MKIAAIRRLLNQRFADLLFSDEEEGTESYLLREEPIREEPYLRLAMAVKLLKPVDLPAAGTYQHEINGAPSFRRVFGAERLEAPIRWIYLGSEEPVKTTGRFTWYDARARTAERTGRSEWRLYYDGAFPAMARQGDMLLVLRFPDGTFSGAVLQSETDWIGAARELEQGGSGTSGSRAGDLQSALVEVGA